MLQRIGRYKILEWIATGGQGTVYRAQDTTLDRIVAVKVINQPVSADPEYLYALQREARLAAGLDHANITTVYDLQVEDGIAFIVMEYLMLWTDTFEAEDVFRGNVLLRLSSRRPVLCSTPTTEVWCTGISNPRTYF